MLFPFSNLSASKLRPALILAEAGREDWIVCQITSNPFNDPHSIPINNSHFSTGSLHHTSFVRPGKLFTAHESLIDSIAGALQPQVTQTIRDSVIAMLQRQ